MCDPVLRVHLDLPFLLTSFPTPPLRTKFALAPPSTVTTGPYLSRLLPKDQVRQPEHQLRHITDKEQHEDQHRDEDE